MPDHHDVMEHAARVDDAVSAGERAVLGEHPLHEALEVLAIVGVLVTDHQFGRRLDLAGSVAV